MKNNFLHGFGFLGVPVYYAGYRLHRLLHAVGLKKSKRLLDPVICVGNLTTGGSGKTPVVIALAGLLDEMGYKVAILSRGYKRAEKDVAPVVVSDGKQLLATLELAGDEPYMIARHAPKAAVIVCADRFRGGVLAMQQIGCDVILMDDGFQHWALHRDIDFVCVDANLPLDSAALLPQGPYREPVSALERASGIFITQIHDEPSAERQAECLDKMGYGKKKPAWKIRTGVTGWQELGSHKISGLESLEGKKVVAACALARPEYFRKTLERLKCRVSHFTALPDHDPYAKKTIDAIERNAKLYKADLVLVTAKDAIKLEGRVGFETPWGYLNYAVMWRENQRDELREFIADTLRPLYK